jgi:hypothetical protein
MLKREFAWFFCCWVPRLKTGRPELLSHARHRHSLSGLARFLWLRLGVSLVPAPFSFSLALANVGHGDKQFTKTDKI